MRIDNTRWERFAQAIVAGSAIGKAYEQAGYSGRGRTAETNGSRLLRNAKVKARIDELFKLAADKMVVDRAGLTQFLLRGIEAALEKGQMSAYGQLVERLGRLHGFAFDPIKEGGSVPRGQITPPEPAPVEKKDEKFVDFEAMAARYGNHK